MVTFNYTSGRDFLIPSNKSSTYRGLAGDDIYVISKDTLTPNADITIVDTKGTNKIQFVEGIVISSTLIAKDALQMTFENNAVLTINGADNFIYDIGGNVTLGKQGNIYTYNELVNILLKSEVPQDSSINNGQTDINIKSDNVTSIDLTSPSNGSSKGTINFSSSTDFVITNQYSTYRGLGGDDTYIISKEIINSGAKINIVDSAGTNKIQLVKDLVISSSLIASDAIRMTFSNDAQVTINGADKFIYDLGGNITNGTQGSIYTFSELVQNVFEVQISKGTVEGKPNVTIIGQTDDKETDITSNNFSISINKNNVVEGGNVTVTISSDVDVDKDTKFSWLASGDDFSGSVDKASNNDLITKSGSVTIPKGENTANFILDIKIDEEAEGLEGVKVEVTNASDGSVIGTETFLISNSDSSGPLTGTDGNDSLYLTDGDDEYLVTKGRDFIDAGDGYDILIITSEDVAIPAIDRRGEYTGIIDEPFVYVTKDESLTIATNFEEIKTQNQEAGVLISGYTPNQVFLIKNDKSLEDINIDDNNIITIDLNDHFYSLNDNITLTFSYSGNNPKLNDQFELNKSILKIQGGKGGDVYSSKITITAEQTFDDLPVVNQDVLTKEVSFNVTMSDDDYIPPPVINASSNVIPDSSNVSEVQVTEDLKGGILLDLTSLGIDEGSIEINYWGPNGERYRADQFTDYFEINKDVLKFKDVVFVNTDRSGFSNTETQRMAINQTDGSYEISFNYTSGQISKTHLLKITEFIDTPYGFGIYGDGNYIRYGESGYNKSLLASHIQSNSYFVPKKNQNSEEIELTFSFIPADANTIRETENKDKYVQTTDARDTILAVSSEYKIAARDILDKTSQIFKLKFTEISSDKYQEADIRFGYFSSTAEGHSIAYADTPGIKAVHIWLDREYNGGKFSEGRIGYGSLLHEIGHGLGLKHPFEDDGPFDIAPSLYNTSLYTNMAYEDVFNSFLTDPYTNPVGGILDLNNYLYMPPSWAMHDIAALGAFYGLRENFKNEDNNYTFLVDDIITHIHDMGGYDILDLSNSSNSSWNLDNPFSYIKLGGGAIFQVGANRLTWQGDNIKTGHVITTSLSTQIEKFIGSKGSDKVEPGPTTEFISTGNGKDLVIISAKDDISKIDIDLGIGDDSLSLYVKDLSDINSLISVNGGDGLDIANLFFDEDLNDIDFTIFRENLNSFEHFDFTNDNPQNVNLDQSDFVSLVDGILRFSGDENDKIIVPTGAEQSRTDNDWIYYVLNDIEIAISYDLIIA